MSTRRTFLKLGAAAGAGALIRWQLDPKSGLLTKTVRAFASVQTQQTALDGATVLKNFGFAEALPTFVGRRVDDSFIEVAMLAFQQKALPDALYATHPNAAVYQYPNHQQATTLWFHDHTLGITRINIFSGLAAFYFIRDQFDTGEDDNPLRLPFGSHEIELMIQDRQFDTSGQLLFPDSPQNPSLVDGPPGNPGLHPFWIPEFFGDVMLVNGRSWPHLDVEPRRYRFRVVNAPNARFLRMGLADSDSGAQGPPIWQIGTDGGLLDRPVKLLGLVEQPATDPSPTTRLFLAPSERGDIILDFTGLAGKRFTLTNDAQVPFPSGSPMATTDPTRSVMEFRVTLPLSSSDSTYNPASGTPLRG